MKKPRLTDANKNLLCPVKVTLNLMFKGYVKLCVCVGGGASKWEDEVGVSYFEHWQHSESPKWINDSILCYANSYVIILSFYLERKMINHILVRMSLLNYWTMLGIKGNSLPEWCDLFLF